MRKLRILLLALLISSSLFARYVYNVYPNSSGIVKYQVFKIADKTKVLDKNIDEHTDIAKLSISSRSDGDLNININIGSKYTLNKPTFLLLDSNNHEIMHKSFNDKTSQINFVLSKNYIKSGINDYKFTYTGKNDKYYFLFYFKSIQITKSFIEPVITQIGCGSSSFNDKAKGFVGDDFAFVAKLSEQLPTSYHMYLAFMGVNDDGSNSGYYSQDYLMSKKDDTTYYYKKTIQKAGNNRKYKIVIKNKNGSTVDSRIGDYTVMKKTPSNPVKFSSANISVVDDNSDSTSYKLHIELSKAPKVLKIETEKTDYKTYFPYIIVNDNNYKGISGPITKIVKSNDMKSWDIYFKIHKTSQTQSKYFKVIVQDKQGVGSNDLVDYRTINFTVAKKVPAENIQKEESEIIEFLNMTSPIVNKMQLNVKTVGATHLSRAESVVLLYEYLKSKNKNFVLPEDVSLYKNPFGDVNN